MASDSDIEAYLNQLNRKTQSLTRDKDEGSQSDSESVFVDKPSAAKDQKNHNSVIDSLSDIRALSEKYGSKKPNRQASNVSSEVTNKKGKDAVRKKTQNEIESEKGESLSSYGKTIASNEKAMQWLKKPSVLSPYARESINDLGREEESTSDYEDDKNVNSSLDEELMQNIDKAQLSASDKQSSEESSDSDGDIIKLANVMTLDDIIGTLDSDSGTPRGKQDSSSPAYSVAVDENVDEKCKRLEDDMSRSEVNDSMHSILQREQEKDPGEKISYKDTKSPLALTYKNSSKSAKNLLLSGNDTVVDSPFYKKENKNDHKTKNNIQYSKSSGNFYAKNRDEDSLELKKNMKELTYKSRSSDEVSTMLTDEADVVESIAESVPSIKEEVDQQEEPSQINEENITVRRPETVGTHDIPQQLRSRRTQKIHYEEEMLSERSCSDTGKHKSHGPLKSTKTEKNEDRVKKGKKQRSSHLKKKVKESSSEDSSESETLSSETSESESCHVCRRRKKRKKGRHKRVYKKYEKTASLSRYIFTPMLYEGMHMVFPPSMVALEEVLRQQVGLTRQFVNCQQAMYQEYSAALSSSHRYTTMTQIEKYIKKKKKKPLSFEKAFEKVKKEMSTRERKNPKHTT
ncbi:uncharacterized protein LOC143028544 [Oratosquilla oratoria]|uniref:uncharacterized protein LOC143028544 n=1 Tax=Oratosquilla oratoria TaxID=337810 RepID=UPI003F758D0B